VRRKQVRSFVEQDDRIRPWISGGKERNGAKLDVDMIVKERYAETRMVYIIGGTKNCNELKGSFWFFKNEE